MRGCDFGGVTRPTGIYINNGTRSRIVTVVGAVRIGAEKCVDAHRVQFGSVVSEGGGKDAGANWNWEIRMLV